MKNPVSTDLTTVALVIGQLELGGGAERQLYELATGLAPQGFRPVVVSLRTGATVQGPNSANYWATTLRERGIRVVEIHRGASLDLRRLWPLTVLLRDQHPAIVHSFLFPANAYARVASLLSGHSTIRITSERSGKLSTRWFDRTVDRMLRPLTDGVITNSQAVSRLLAARGARVPVWVIPNGIDGSRYKPERRSAARAALGLPLDCPVVGTVARMSTEKNYPFFIRLVCELRQTLPKLRALAIGDGVLRTMVEDEIKRAGIGDTLTLLGKLERVEEVLPALDVFILVSDYEGLSNAIMEAQASAVPCVVSDVGGNSEIIVDGRTGFLVADLDLATYVGRIISILSNPNMRAEMGQKARRRMEEVFGLERMISETAMVYRHFLRQRHGCA